MDLILNIKNYLVQYFGWGYYPRKRCGECQKLNQKSLVYWDKSSCCKLDYPAYYDNDGVYRGPSSYKVWTSKYHCSNGHKWEGKAREGKRLEGVEHQTSVTTW